MVSKITLILTIDSKISAFISLSSSCPSFPFKMLLAAFGNQCVRQQVNQLT